MGFWSVVLTFTTSTLMLSNFLYTPLPENIQEPWKFQFLLGILKANQYLGQIAVFFGVDSLVVFRTTLPWIFIAAAQEPTENVKITNTIFNDVKVRLYEPMERRGQVLPGLVYYHGGGFITFSVDTYDKVLRQLCIDAHVVIMAPEYRLSPEYPFPVPLSDCVDATEYFLNHANEYGVDRHNIGLAGDSAGGNLAAAVTYKLAYQMNTSVKYQILIYPELQPFDLKTPSMVLHDATLPSLMTTEAVALAFALYWKGREGFQYISELLKNSHITDDTKYSKYIQYLDKTSLSDSSSKRSSTKLESAVNEQFSKYFFSTLTNPLYSPLMADDLSKMPSTFIVVGEYDVLRDDGIMYRNRLHDAGVDVRLLHRKDGYHAMFSFTRLKIGKEVMKEIVTYISSDKRV